MDFHNAISSRASAFGATPCAEPDGPTTNPYGPDLARASLSARQAKELGLLTSGTFGPPFTTSSSLASLQSCLANRLQANTEELGSLLFRLTWKEWVIPSGLRICALRASAPRTSGSAFTGWLTPKLPSGGGQLERTTSGGGLRKLEDQALLVGWPTATTRDWKSGASNLHGQNARPLNEVARLASWPTPLAVPDSQASHGQLSGSLRREYQRIGPIVTGFPAETAKPGQLNPAHSRWLMGLPPEWDACAPTATPSSRKSRKHSSAPTPRQ